MPLHTQPWRGRSCAIVGSGLSLSGFNFRALDGHLVIAINRAFEHTSPAVHLSVDPCYYRDLMKGSYPEGPEYTASVRERLRHYERGHKVFACSVACQDVPDWITRVPCRDNGWSTRWEDGIGRFGMSEFSALSLACLMGASTVYLLGIDMKSGRFHTGYRGRRTLDRSYAAQVARHEAVAAPAIRESGVRVVNLNPESALRCYEFGTYADVKPQPFPLVISFHTPDDHYTAHASRLKASLRDFGMEAEIECLPAAGSWKANACMKPDFILRKMRAHPGRPLLWLDADATVERFPEAFVGMDADMAAHWRDGRELLSSTVYFGGTAGAREIAESWLAKCLENPNRPCADQENLQDAANEERYRVQRLPAEYACIFDRMAHLCPDPIIKQWQASRIGRRLQGDRNARTQHAQ